MVIEMGNKKCSKILDGIKYWYRESDPEDLFYTMPAKLYLESFKFIKYLNMRYFINVALEEYIRETRGGFYDIPKNSRGKVELDTTHELMNLSVTINKETYGLMIALMKDLGFKRHDGFLTYIIREAVAIKVKKEKEKGNYCDCVELNSSTKTVFRPKEIIFKRLLDDPSLLESLKKKFPPSKRSLRNRKPKIVDGQEVVPVGTKVPFDVKLYINEHKIFHHAALTEGVKILLEEIDKEGLDFITSSSDREELLVPFYGNIPPEFCEFIDRLPYDRTEVLRIALDLFVGEHRKGACSCKKISALFLFDPTIILWNEEKTPSPDELNAVRSPDESDMEVIRKEQKEAEDCKGDSKYKWVILAGMIILMIFVSIYYLVK